MKWYGVRTSVCHSLSVARGVGDIDRLLHGRRRSSTGPRHGAQQQMRAVPSFQQNTDLFFWREACLIVMCAQVCNVECCLSCESHVFRGNSAILMSRPMNRVK